MMVTCDKRKNKLLKDRCGRSLPFLERVVVRAACVRIQTCVAEVTFLDDACVRAPVARCIVAVIALLAAFEDARTRVASHMRLARSVAIVRPPRARVTDRTLQFRL